MFLSNKPNLSSKEKVEYMKELFVKIEKEIENKGCIVENKDAIYFWLDNNLIFFIESKEETWYSSDKETMILNSKVQDHKNRKRIIEYANQLIKKYSLKVENGNIEAKIVLGGIYESMGDIYKAIDWYIDGLNSSHISPSIKLKTLVTLGGICEYMYSPFLNKTIDYYTEAANQGHIPAMHALRDLYLKLTPKRDLKQAIYWQEQILNARINELNYIV